MNGPDFEGVLTRHVVYGFNGTETACRCSPRIWRNERDYRSHLSAALHAEVARWLADEGTAREVVDALPFYAYEGTLAAMQTALAALTTTTREDHR